MDRIGKYEILEKIGQGAMGAVYRARDSIIGRDVAIKVIQDNALNKPGIRERFYREARSAGRLSHENITTIYDVGEDDGRAFIVMEYLEGDDLRSMLDPNANYTAEDKLDVAIQICQGLHYAHRHNVIHRDIKPDNVRVLPNGRVKILDFGIARIQDDTEIQTLTLTGMSVGTPRYMSPEQIRGEKLDARSDIFSFGVLFYELLSGKPPFSGDRVTTIIYKILNVDPEPAEFDPKAISSELHPVLFKCLAKQKEERYSDFTEILRDLQSVLRRAACRDDSLKSQILDSNISDFLAKDAATYPAEPHPEMLKRKTSSMSNRRALFGAGVAALFIILATIGVLVLGSEPTTPSDEIPSSDSAESVGKLDLDDEAGVDNSKQTLSLSTGSTARNDAQETGAEQLPDKSSEQAAPTNADEESTESGADGPDPKLDGDSMLGEGVTDLELPPPDPTEADAARNVMLDTKGDISPDMLQHPVYLAAVNLQDQANESYEAADYDGAAEIFRNAELGFVEAGTVRSNLDSAITQLMKLLESGFGEKNLDSLQEVHPFYASDYYTNLLGVAVELMATAEASNIDVAAQGASALIYTKFLYKNNKNEEIGFERSERWTFREVNARWTLAEVQSF